VAISLSFLGGAGSVTASKYALENHDTKLLVDCGLFQGFKALRLKNWAPFPIAPRSIKTVILTHAHLDHSGYLPLLVKHGFAGPIHCSKSTADLCEILWPDAGHLQEKDANSPTAMDFPSISRRCPFMTRKMRAKRSSILP
jgi:metallo-beta-lactamase family protein